jgi:hypothetical protein
MEECLSTLDTFPFKHSLTYQYVSCFGYISFSCGEEPMPILDSFRGNQALTCLMLSRADLGEGLRGLQPPYFREVFNKIKF